MFRQFISFFIAVTLVSCSKTSEVEVVSLRSESAEQDTKNDLQKRAQRQLRIRKIRQFIKLRIPTQPTFLTDVAGEVMEEIIRNEAPPSVEVLLELGELLFGHEFTVEEGMANDIQRVGGHDSNSCASCHWQSGVAGSGAVTDNSFLNSNSGQLSDYDSLNPPSLRGVGVIDLLAQEMTEDLKELKNTLLRDTSPGVRGEVQLKTKEVSFGLLQLSDTGELDYSQVEGVDNDLVIKPFRWKGTTKTLEGFVIESLISHMGYNEYLSVDRREFFLTWFLASLPPPQFGPVSSYEALLEEPRSPTGTLVKIFEDEWNQGSKIFENIGCASCHVMSMPLRTTVFRTSARNGLPALQYDFAKLWGLEFSEAENAHIVRVFSDLKRHDLGDDNASLHYDRGVPPKTFMTRRLWDVANSAPFMHDGRASWISHAIAEHGGEAQQAREAYMSLPEEKKAELRVFLMSLQKNASPVVR